MIDDEDVKKVIKNRKNLKTYGNKFFTENSLVDPRNPYSANDKKYFIREKSSKWYLENQEWVNEVVLGNHQKCIEKGK